MDHVDSDADLIRGALAGNAAAFGKLVNRYERSVFGVALAILRDRQLAEATIPDQVSQMRSQSS